eukprot:14022493-Ditylum_brightwellii.AAC.1
MGQTIHLESIDEDYSPVKALARRVFHNFDNKGTDTSPLCQYVTEDTIRNVTPTDMINTIGETVTRLGLHKASIDPDLVCVHSLRSGGVMALKLSGESDTTIMKQGGGQASPSCNTYIIK